MESLPHIAASALFESNAMHWSHTSGGLEKACAHAGSPLSLKDSALSGLCAGFVVAFLASPTELVKCRLQHQGTVAVAQAKWKAWDLGGRQGPAPTLYAGPSDVVQTIWRNEQGLRGLSTGLGATIARDAPGCAVMFAAYDALKTSLARWSVCSPDCM